MVFDDEIFFPNRLKTSFICVLISWVGIIANVECSLVIILLCILLGLLALFFEGDRYLFFPFLVVQVWCPCELPVYLGVFQALHVFGNILLSLPIK